MSGRPLRRPKRTSSLTNPIPYYLLMRFTVFSKSQQDSLLGAVEQGIVTLIGATTENPSFEVISPLLSRCQVYILNTLSQGDLEELLQRALAKDPYLKKLKIKIRDKKAMLQYSGGMPENCSTLWMWWSDLRPPAPASTKI
jgi:putative ATPase